ncbi:MAG TPA: nucleotidyl transferase AbiEii/AbiGii toxin family protein [Gemmatimonadaceae bacterium]
MIPRAYLTEWGVLAPWPTVTQIEQDLILSRLIAEIAAHPLLSRELAFRGGTCLHKLHLRRSYRYSEDLDYVRINNTPRLGDAFSALREIAIERVGLHEHRRSFPTEESDVACIWFDAEPTSEEGLIRVKIEINTAETDPFRECLLRPYAVHSRWWSGSADVPTFDLNELLATKLRALYQRRKGRDLFDLWVALDTTSVDDQLVAEALSHYMRESTFSYRQLDQNLQGKLEDRGFLEDVDRLVAELLRFPRFVGPRR